MVITVQIFKEREAVYCFHGFAFYRFKSARQELFANSFEYLAGLAINRRVARNMPAFLVDNPMRVQEPEHYNNLILKQIRDLACG